METNKLIILNNIKGSLVTALFLFNIMRYSPDLYELQDCRKSFWKCLSVSFWVQDNSNYILVCSYVFFT